LIAQILGLPVNPLTTFLTLALGALLTFFLLAGVSYYIFFVRARRIFHPTYERDPAELRESIKWSAYAMIGNAVLVAPIHYLLATGHGKLYFSVADYGWGWLVASIVLMLCVSETMIYWIHRVLHWGFLFERIHKKHHEFRLPTPFVAVAFRPLDPFLQGLPHHIVAFLFPMHIAVYLVSLGFVSVWAVMIHDRVSFISWKVINYTGHHTLHHWYTDYNFGQYLTLWDRLAGTYKDPDRCDDVPDHVLVRARDALATSR
jgi:lathosterol oxidase